MKPTPTEPIEETVTSDTKTKKKGVYIPRWLFNTILVLLVIIIAFGVGWHYGAAHEKTAEKASPFGVSSQASLVRHKVLIGTVTAISGSSITVKSDDKTSGSAAISKSTVISNTKQQTITTADIKTTNRVVVTAAINKDNSLAAQRILVIQ